MARKKLKKVILVQIDADEVKDLILDTLEAFGKLTSWSGIIWIIKNKGDIKDLIDRWEEIFEDNFEED